MSIPNYRLLKGAPVGPGSVSGGNPHYRFSLTAGEAGSTFAVDVNVRSQDGSEILYLIENSFTPPDGAALGLVNPGLNALMGDRSGLRLDFLRSGPDGGPLVNRSQMKLLSLGSGSAVMSNAVSELLDQALADPDGTIYVYGSAYSDAGGVMGMHNIHMNQGNPPGPFANDNGTYQDGAIFIELPGQQAWSALFIAFQSESWTTDGQGNPQ